MQTLPKDVTIEMALNLSPPDLVSFCSASKTQNRVCNSDDFWRRKLQRDYPEKFLEGIKNPKEIYIKKFTYVSRRIEKLLIEVIRESFPENFYKFLTTEYKDELYTRLYKIYEMMKNEEIEGQEEYDEIIEQLQDYIPEDSLNGEDASTPFTVMNTLRSIIQKE